MRHNYLVEFGYIFGYFHIWWSTFYLPNWASKFEHFDILLARHGILLAPGKRAISASVEPCINIFTIGDFHNVFKFHGYSVNKRLFLTTAKLVRGLSDVSTTNICEVDTSNRNYIERSRWMKWLITGLRQKKYPLIWIHIYESGLLHCS